MVKPPYTGNVAMSVMATAQLFAVARLVDTDAHRRRVREAVHRRDRNALKKLASLLPLRECSARTLDYLASQLAWSDQVDTAIMVWRTAHRHHPDDFWINHNLALWLNISHPPPAGKHSSVGGPRPPHAVGRLRHEEALRFYEAAMALRPESADMWYHLGTTLMYLERWDDAITAYERVLEKDENHTASVNNIGVILSDVKREPEMALEYYERCILLDVDNPTYRYNSGQVLLQLRRIKKALNRFRESIDLEYPDLADAWQQIGTCQLRLGKEHEAIAAAP